MKIKSERRNVMGTGERAWFPWQFMGGVAEIAQKIDPKAVERIVDHLWELRRRGGKLFVFGVGGSAAMSSHAVNDFRKLCNINAYTPVDNVSELTARVNDDGWDSVFVSSLIINNAGEDDAALVFSVGGGSVEKNISMSIVRALDEARARGMKIFGVVGRDGGYTKKIGNEVIVVPTIEDSLVTAYAESFHAVLLHCIVFHPRLRVQEGKWESMAR